MNKKIIALAIVSAISAPAFADSSNVTMYGQLNGSIDSVSNGTGGIRTTIINSNSSRLGLKGSEDLGGGTAAIFQIEASVNFAGTNTGATPANSLASRDSFVGLSDGSMGTVLVGRHDTPYKMAGRGYDLFADNIADNRTLMGTGAINFDGRQGNVLAYVTPGMSGFTGVIAYVAGAEAASTSGQNKGDAYSLAGLYGNGPLHLSAAYEAHNVGTAGTGLAGAGGVPLAAGTFAVGQAVGGVTLPVGSKESAWRIGGSYDINSFLITAEYEKTSDNFGAAGANALGHKAYYLGGKYSFGANAVKLSYANAGNIGAAANTGAKQWAVGFDHNMSKRTSVYALYTNLKNDSAAQYGLTGGADVAPARPVALGQSATALSFGLKHAF